jgi:hypothetical protein
MPAVKPSSVVILLTATVDPHGMSRTVVADPDTRLREYHRVVRDVAAQLPGVPIVVCDNSGSGVEQTAQGEQAMPWPAHVRFVSFEEPRQTQWRGKGYGEMGIIEHVLQHVPEATTARLVVKVTGRYRVANVGRLVCSIAAAGPVDVVVDLVAGLTQADCRFFASSPRFLVDYLIPMREKLDDDRGVCFEHVLAQAVHRAMADGLVWRPMPDVPIIVGRSGTSGQLYASGGMRVLIRRIRKLMRRLSEPRPLIHDS